MSETENPIIDNELFNQIDTALGSGDFFTSGLDLKEGFGKSTITIYTKNATHYIGNVVSTEFPREELPPTMIWIDRQPNEEQKYNYQLISGSVVQDEGTLKVLLINPGNED